MIERTFSSLPEGVAVVEASGDEGVEVEGASRPVFVTSGFEQIDETSTYGAYVGGMAGAYEDAGLAGNYVTSAAMLVERALRDETIHEVALPVLFLYRHALELRLKYAVQPAKLDHDLDVLAAKLDELLLARRGAGLSRPLLERVHEIARFDPRADAFRFTYKTRKRLPDGAHFPEEVWVDLVHLRAEMHWIDRELQLAGELLRA